jgi:hypothetical protein
MMMINIKQKVAGSLAVALPIAALTLVMSKPPVVAANGMCGSESCEMFFQCWDLGYRGIYPGYVDTTGDYCTYIVCTQFPGDYTATWLCIE